ncbi:MAG: ribonuclease Z, partial [Erysipelotrichia bacterium]|nr:ribonuclease Z [Erysipelotrichia bacterium]
GKNILFDCGGGTSRQLLRYQLTKDHLDAIVISHYHPDHVCGLMMVLQMLYLEGRAKPLQLFLPERPAAFMDILHFFYTFEQRFPFELHVLPVDEIDLYLEDVIPAMTDHLSGYEDYIREHQLLNQMKSFSFRIGKPDSALVYTSDLSDVPCILSLIEGCHTVVIDAMHPPATSVLSLPKHGVQRIILTHGMSVPLSQMLAEHPDPRFEIAVEGKVYSL